jgi:hypothetical protein
MPDQFTHDEKAQIDRRIPPTDSIYVNPEDRFIVVLAVGYDPESTPTKKDALEAALELTRDGAQEGTVWMVLDRITGEVEHVEQGDFDPQTEEAARDVADQEIAQDEARSDRERVEAFLRLEPRAMASRIANEVGIPHEAVMAVLGERRNRRAAEGAAGPDSGGRAA